MTDDKLIETFMDSFFIAATIVVCVLLACGLLVYWRFFDA